MSFSPTDDFYRAAVLKIMPDAQAQPYLGTQGFKIMSDNRHLANGDTEASAWYYAYHYLGLNKPEAIVPPLFTHVGEIFMRSPMNPDIATDTFLLFSVMLEAHKGKRVRVTVEELPPE